MNVELIEKTPRVIFFDKVAESWNESLSPEEELFLRFVFQKAETSPELGRNLLDVGCGTGILFPFLEQWNITALDISEEMLKRAKKKQAHNVVDYVCGTAEALPFSDEYFANVIMLAVYPHFDDPLKALQETYRVLKPGGILSLIHLKDRATVNKIHASIDGAINNDRLPDASELLRTLRKAQFEIIHSDFNTQVAVICRKPES